MTGRTEDTGEVDETALVGAAISADEMPEGPATSSTNESAGAPVGKDELRHAMSRVLTGVMALTTIDHRHDHAITINSLTSVSLEPPLVLVSLHEEARALAALRVSGRWVVNVLPASARNLATRFADVGRPTQGQLDRVAYSRSEHGVALLDEATMRLRVRTTAEYPGGDHRIVLGEVEKVDIPPVIGPALASYRGELFSVD